MPGSSCPRWRVSVLTKSGREMIDALIAGQRDPAVLAEMAKGRMRSKIPELQDALAGRFNGHHALERRDWIRRRSGRLPGSYHESSRTYSGRSTSNCSGNISRS